MPNPRFMTVLLVAAVAVLAGCSDATDPVSDNENELTGTRWVRTGYEDGVEVFEAVARLEGDRNGYAFEEDGELIHRTSGWCGTPPLTFTDVRGAWALGDDEVLELASGALPDNPQRFEIVRHTRRELRLRRLVVEPPVHAFLQGTWEGIYVESSTNPLVMAPTIVGDVVFAVDGAAFEVTGEQERYPPPARGLLAVGETVVLRDLLMHTADYDWQMNINGHFLWKLEDGELVLHQDMKTRAVAREFRLRRVAD